MNKTILLADDDAGVRRMLARALEAEQYEVILARTGREAVAAFLLQAPDLVLLDLNLPEKDGWEVFHLMRQLNRSQPIIVITGKPNQFARALHHSASALMEKPLDLPLLLAALERLLSFVSVRACLEAGNSKVIGRCGDPRSWMPQAPCEKTNSSGG